MSDKGDYVEWPIGHGAHAAHGLERSVAAQAGAGEGGTPSRGSPIAGVQRFLISNLGKTRGWAVRGERERECGEDGEVTMRRAKKQKKAKIVRLAKIFC